GGSGGTAGPGGGREGLGDGGRLGGPPRRRRPARAGRGGGAARACLRGHPPRTVPSRRLRQGQVRVALRRRRGEPRTAGTPGWRPDKTGSSSRFQATSDGPAADV